MLKGYWKKNPRKKVMLLFFLSLLWKEIKKIFWDWDVIILLLAGPILLTVLFGGVYFNSYVEDIPIAVLDEDHSSLSRMIVQQFDENDRFDVRYFASSKEELDELIKDREIHMAVYIPNDFAKDVNELKSSEVLVIVDGTNIIIGNNAYATAASIIQTIAAGTQIKILQAKGMMPQIAENMALAFQFRERVLYDSRMTYMNYLILGFVAVFLQQVMVSGVGIAVIKDLEKIAQEKTWQQILLKVLAAGFFGLISTCIAVGITAIFFKVPIRGSLLGALLMCVIFIFAISCPAIILAAITKDSLKFVQISFMLSLPTFVSCGYVWPTEQMPSFLPTLIKMFWPLIYFARPFDEVLMKGVSLEAVSTNITQMILYTIIWMPIAMLILQKSIKKDSISEKNSCKVES